MSRPRKYSIKQVEEVKTLAKTGMPDSEISKITKVSISKVGHISRTLWINEMDNKKNNNNE